MESNSNHDIPISRTSSPEEPLPPDRPPQKSPTVSDPNESVLEEARDKSNDIKPRMPRSLLRPSSWRKLPTAFLFAGLFLAALTIPLYPYRHPLQRVPFPEIIVQSPGKATVSSFSYNSIAQPSGVLDIRIDFNVANYAKGKTIGLYVYFPSGSEILRCPKSCNAEQNSAGSWSGNLVVQPGGHPAPDGFAGSEFIVRGTNLGYTANGLNALAVSPDVFFSKPPRNTPRFSVEYVFPAADNYDWSNSPYVQAGAVSWEEVVANGYAPQVSEDGVNQTTQNFDSLRTFLAGALVALAGSALLAAFQEHMRSE